MLSLVKERLNELDLEQKDLATAAGVTESYVSQLLNRKKTPPAPERTDIYGRMERVLRLPEGRLSGLAGLERVDAIKRRISDPPAPLFKEVRKLVLRKCAPSTRAAVQANFERQPFGEVERFVTQRLVDVAKSLAREELDNEDWLRRFAKIRKRSYEAVRVDILEFLDTDVFHVSDESAAVSMAPLIDSWDIDLVSFGMTVNLSRRLGPVPARRFEFLEVHPEAPAGMEPGLKEFFGDSSLSGDVTEPEAAFLKRLRFDGLRPTPLYFYRELQSLRDPLHFLAHPEPDAKPKSSARKPSKRNQEGADPAPIRSRRPLRQRSSS